MPDQESKSRIIEPYLHLPHYGLKVHNPHNFTYAANVPVLNQPTVEQIIGNPGLSLNGVIRHRDEIREKNKALLDSSDSITVVLDGRINIYNQGFIGDMIEAARLVTSFREVGKKVQIVTSNADLFDGSTDRGIKVSPMPADLPSAAEQTWQPSLLEHLGKVSDGSPVFLPLNARLPLLLDIDSDGQIANRSHVAQLARFLSQNEQQPGIAPRRWWHRGIHQLQALQITADLVGIDGVYDWKKFPDAFLEPRRSAVTTAEKVVNIYRCLFDGPNHDETPLLIHPGVATNGRKLAMKSYPEKKWEQVIEGVKSENLPIKSITLLKPVDSEQGAMASRLAKYSEKLGMKTAVLPEQELRARFGWSLGSFIAFLRELSRRNGIILGCDSMPAGHAAPAVDVPAVVLGSPSYNPGFYCPPKDALVVMPDPQIFPAFTSDINPSQVINALKDITAKNN